MLASSRATLKDLKELLELSNAAVHLRDIPDVGSLRLASGSGMASVMFALSPLTLVISFLRVRSACPLPHHHVHKVSSALHDGADLVKVPLHVLSSSLFNSWFDGSVSFVSNARAWPTENTDSGRATWIIRVS
ncbi:hypothetical protein A0H81_13941 [Grifola frondosa]|uniref:Uncharacterized protein n=1 Tax=Grifola frondosa TaxID=5627 RepID=A0A1C7LMT0_GRIFR|nr:hypothetical protein A0H81_13941 [Grifola frondosa]